jgi:YD repeat-containing protein
MFWRFWSGHNPRFNANTALDWQQEYNYDRYGNRTIRQANTGAAGINKNDFTANVDNKNRLGVPARQSGTMTYDPPGNLTTDTYSAVAVTRAYDAENRMASETQANSYLAGSYTYNADGQRVRRNVDGNETWQVYGSAANYWLNIIPVAYGTTLTRCAR